MKKEKKVKTAVKRLELRAWAGQWPRGQGGLLWGRTSQLRPVLVRKIETTLGISNNQNFTQRSGYPADGRSEDKSVIDIGNAGSLPEGGDVTGAQMLDHVDEAWQELEPWLALLGSTWDCGGEAVSGKCLQKWWGKRKDTQREKEILLFSSLLPSFQHLLLAKSPKSYCQGSWKMWCEGEGWVGNQRGRKEVITRTRRGLARKRSGEPV